MANQEHVDRLLQGVKAWNLWRRENPEIEPNLSSANLHSADLRSAILTRAILNYADLRGATLIGAILTCANLSRANLKHANLSRANLRHANLSHANLRHAIVNEETQLDYKWRLVWSIVNEGAAGANLRGADLRDADLSSADLRDADLRDANIKGIDLRDTDLSGAELGGADLSGAIVNKETQLDYKWRLVWSIVNEGAAGANLGGADLSRANLEGASLEGASLSGAKLNGVNLKNAKLRGTDLSGAELGGADLSGADLSGANLSTVQALYTKLQTATLTGACIEDWHINSGTNLKEIICEYIFIEWGWFTERFTDRRPHNPNQIFAPGEFTKRYQIVLETVELFFNDGIDWKAFLASLQDLKSEYGDDLNLQGIEKKAGGSFVVRLEVPSDADKGAVEREIKALYQTNFEVLEARYHAELQAKDKEIESYRRESVNMMEIAKLLASKPITVEAKAEAVAENQSKNITYNQQGSKWGGGFAADGGTQTGGTFNDFSQNIEQNINEIGSLIESLRSKAESFPKAQRSEAIDHLSDLATDLEQPPEKRKVSRMKAALLALVGIATAVSGAVTSTNEFVGQVKELSEKLGIELPIEQLQPQPQNAIDVEAIGSEQP